MKDLKGKKKLFQLAFLAERALKEAVQEVIKDHKRRGDSLAVWRNGKVVHVPAKRLAT